MTRQHAWSCTLATLLVLSALLAAPAARAREPQPDPNPWRPLLGPPGGFVGNISLSPAFSQDHTLYAGAARSGVYRSSDAGSTWSVVGPEYLCGS